MKTKRTSQACNVTVAVLLVIGASFAGYKNIGLPPVVIVGGSGLIGLIMWYKTYLKNPVEPRVILPLFLLTVAALEIHMAEEYLTRFGPAMSRLFDISWTERSFLMIFAFIGSVIYTLTALGLYYKIRLAGFIAWFIFIGPGVAEFTHFIFPLLRPEIEPDLNATISRSVSNGVFIEGMPNYYIKTTGTYYFSGLWTAVLPMIPGIYAIYKLIKINRAMKMDS